MMRSCEEIRPQLSEYLDGDLPAETLATIRGHLGGCAACRGVVADFARVRETARNLGPIEPPSHVWLEVAGRVRADAEPSSRRQAPAADPPRNARGAWWQWAGLAASLVIVTFVVYELEPRDGSSPASSTAIPSTPSATNIATGGNASAPHSVETVQEELTQAMQHYQNAIAGLETIAREGRGDIDPTVATKMQQSLGAADRAIAESQGALVDEPTNLPARDSLFEALRQKISVLEATVALINQMRQADQEGAARITAGRGKSS